MAELDKIDSNVTELRIAEEASYKTLLLAPGDIWEPFEPNSYSDFGGSVTTKARNPINSSRQRKKGNVVDLDASGGIESDVTQTNMQKVLQGFMFADLRPKTEFGGGTEITGVVASSDTFTAASGLDAFKVGDIIFGSGFTNAANNGKHIVTVVTATVLTVGASSLVDETPASGAKLVQVGFEFVSGDLDVDASGSLPILTTGIKSFVDLGIISGETIFIGGDGVNDFVTNASNNGVKRVRGIPTANSMTIDKSDVAMITELSANVVEMYFGRVLKNELGSLITRRSYQAERKLGAPDDASPADVQAEYLVGGIANVFNMTVANSDLVTASLEFIFATHETIDAATALKSASGTTPALVESDAFNTSSDYSRIKMALVSDTDEAIAPLFAFLTDFNLNINNNAKPLKAVGVTGGFEVTSGTFEVSGDLTAYFTKVSAIQAVQSNSDVTLDFFMVKSNTGMAVDVPLIALGDGRANIEQDEAITIPLSSEAATGAKIDPSLDHTLMFVWFDYLPNAADV